MANPSEPGNFSAPNKVPIYEKSERIIDAVAIHLAGENRTGGLILKQRADIFKRL